MSGPSQGDAAAKVDEDRGRDGGGRVRARAEEQWRKEEEGWRKGPSDRPIYKGELIKRARESRRPWRGYLPTKRLDSREDSKYKDPLRVWRSKQRA